MELTVTVQKLKKPQLKHLYSGTGIALYSSHA